MRVLLLAEKDSSLIQEAFKVAKDMVDLTHEEEEVAYLLDFYAYDAVVIQRPLQEPLNHAFFETLTSRANRAKCPVIVVAKDLKERQAFYILQKGFLLLQDTNFSATRMVLNIRNMVKLNLGGPLDRRQYGSLVIDYSAKIVYVADRPVSLTPKEYSVFEYLSRNPGRVITREALVDYIYGGVDEPNPKIIDVFVCKIRKKFNASGISGQEMLKTQWGHGNMFVPPGESASSAHVVNPLPPPAPATQLVEAT